MPVKPGDLLLSVIEFFGILIPGAVLILLLLLTVEQVKTVPVDWNDPPWLKGWVGWVAGFFASYTLGHFLLALSEFLLDPLATLIPWEKANKTDEYCEEVCKDSGLPEIVLRAERERKRRELEKLKGQPVKHKKLKKLREQIAKHKKLKAVAFYTFLFIRIKNADAIADIERNAADYKLFRSLVVVFLLDFLISALSLLFFDSLPLWRFLVSIIGLVFSWYRFYLAFNWTYQLGFEFYLILRKLEPAGNETRRSSEEGGGRETPGEESSPVLSCNS